MSLLTTVLLLAASAVSSPAVERFDMANYDYRNGDFTSAVAGYQRVLALTGPNAVTYYNLGNAWYRAGSFPEAIACYERALQLEPDLEQARQNLTFAVRQTERRLPRPAPREWADDVFFWQSRFAPGTLVELAVSAWVIFWVVLGLRQWRPVPYTRVAALFLLLAVAALGASAWFRAHPPVLAVASAERVPVHYGVSESDTVRFELYAGDRVSVDALRDGWARVETADGERGWAQTEHLLLVGPAGDAALAAQGGVQ
jgi:tetratricopeptide (TPR) repeat protein